MGTSSTERIIYVQIRATKKNALRSPFLCRAPLTNLMNLTVDTSWYTRFHSTTNPDFGATYQQAITLSEVPGIPRTNADFKLSNIQAIANIAAFHFGFIEQAGSSLYATDR